MTEYPLVDDFRTGLFFYFPEQNHISLMCHSHECTALKHETSATWWVWFFLSFAAVGNASQAELNYFVQLFSLSLSSGMDILNNFVRTRSLAIIRDHVFIRKQKRAQDRTTSGTASKSDSIIIAPLCHKIKYFLRFYCGTQYTHVLSHGVFCSGVQRWRLKRPVRPGRKCKSRNAFIWHEYLAQGST